MEPRKIADILFNLSLDMDYGDINQFYDEEVLHLTMEIEKLKKNDSPLFYVLEAIAEENEDMYQWALRR